MAYYSQFPQLYTATDRRRCVLTSTLCERDRDDLTGHKRGPTQPDNREDSGSVM